MIPVCDKIKKEREINTFIHYGCIKLIKSDNEDIYNVMLRQFY